MHKAHTGCQAESCIKLNSEELGSGTWRDVCVPVLINGFLDDVLLFLLVKSGNNLDYQKIDLFI